ncbi:MAG: hypothetical protein ACRDFQ_07595, partial [Anaerolineales bacterium]
MYMCIGLAYLPSGIERVFQKTKGQVEAMSTRGSFLMPGIFALLFLAGASVTVAERQIPDRDFVSFTVEAEALFIQQGILTSAELETFLQQEDAVFISGIALYPRYFQPNTRFSPVDMPEDLRYLHFLLIGDTGGQVVLPLRNVPSGIPHTEEVTVLGCETPGYISTWAIITHSTSNQILTRDPLAPLSCPLDEPD